MRILRPLPIVLAWAAMAPAAAHAALPPQLVAADCPGGADCVAPADQSVVPTGFTRATTATLRASDVSGSGVDRLEYVLDDGPVTTAAWGEVVGLGADGPHTLHTRAVDRAGNSSEWRTWTFHVDTAVPSDFTAPPPAGWNTSSPVELALLGADVAGGSGLDRMEFRIGAGPVRAAASGEPVVLAGDGVFTVTHRAVDVAGNASDWRTGTVRIDTALPTDTTLVPAGWVADTATLTLAGSDATSGVDAIRWRVPGGPAQSASSGSLLPVRTGGVSTVETQVLDRAGNASAWRPNTVRVDTQDPVDTTGAPAGWQTVSPVTVTVSGTDTQAGVAAVEWMLDSPAVRRSASASAPVTVAGDGVHQLDTRVVDGAGRQTAWRRSTVSIDTTDPTNNTTVPAGWSTGAVDVTLTGADAGSGVARIEWSLDGGGVTNGAPGTVVRVEPDGVHTLRTSVVDVAGRRTTVDRTVRIDRIAPVETSTVPARVPFGPSGRVALTAADATSGVARVEWRVDGTAGSGPAGSRVDLGGPGEHTLQRRFVDHAGNASGWTTDTVTVDPQLNGDTDVPVDVTAPPVGWQTGPVEVAIGGTDATTAVGRVRWRLDGGSVRTGPPGSVIVLAGDGVHRFDTEVVDLVGHASGWRSHEVRIDAAVPSDTTVAGVGWQREPQVTLTGTDALSGLGQMEWSLDGGPRRSGPSGTTVGPLAEGEHRLEHRAVDVAGNASAWRGATVRVDLTDPVDRTPALPAGWQTEPVTVVPDGGDALSGLAAVDVEVGSSAVATRPVVLDADGTHVLRTRARDRAGNATAWRAQTVRVDRSAPLPTLSCAPANEPTGHRCRAAATDAVSGLAALRVRVDGGAWTDLALDGATVPVAAGTVELEAVDVAGNVARVTSERLPERFLPPAPAAAASADPPAPAPAPSPALPAAPASTPPRPGDAAAAPRLPEPNRSRRVTVARRGGGSDAILGSLELIAAPGDGGAAIVADVRPLSLGAGRQRLVLQLRAGRLRAQRVRTVRLGRAGGYSPRLEATLAGVRRAAVARLTVSRRRDGRWVTVAVATATLRP